LIEGLKKRRTVCLLKGWRNAGLYTEQMEDFGSGGLNEFTFFD